MRSSPPRAAGQLESPSDREARYRTKRDTQWLGYLVHDTETCEQKQVSLITHVQTTPATVHDSQCTALIQDALSARQLTPREHIVATAYIDAELLVKSAKDHHLTVVGPARPKAGWQNKVAEASGYDQFTVDWERKQVRCPQGKWSLRGTNAAIRVMIRGLRRIFAPRIVPHVPRALCVRVRRVSPGS